MTSLSVFQGPEHLPFSWDSHGEKSVLLVHGFPGTPAEMRPLGEILAAHGFNVSGILLPGFGAQIGQLGTYHYQDWVDTIVDELRIISRHEMPVLVVGYSLGAALSLQAVVRERANRLVLLAPFWRLNAGIRGVMLPVLKKLFPKFRPFEKADFSDSGVRRTVASFAPEVDLDDPEMQRAIRELAISSNTIDEIRKAGREAFRAARYVEIPSLVVQSKNDELVRVDDTRRLVKELPPETRYCEVQGKHDLVNPGSSAWLDVSRVVLDFALTL